jgi:hypothetical protein
VKIAQRIYAKKAAFAYAILASLLCLYYSKFGLGNDYQVYFESGSQVRSLKSPWNLGGNINALYLHGPISSIWMSLFTFLPQSFGLNILRIMSLLVIPLIFRTTLRVIGGVSYSNQTFWMISCLIILSFPIRASLQYGRFEILVFAVFTYLIFRIRQAESTLDFLFVGLLIGIIVDYKPHIFLLPSILLLLIFRKLYLYIGLVGSIFLGSLISVVLTNRLPYLDWIKIILERGKGVQTEDDSGLFSIKYGFGIGPFISVALGFALILLFALKYNYLKSSSFIRKTLAFILVYVLFLPILHPQDLIWVPVIHSVLYIRYRVENILQYWLLLGFLLVWSNSIIINIGLVMLINIIFYLVVQKIDFKLFLKISGVMFIPFVLFYSIGNFFPSSGEGHARHFIAVMSIILICWLFVKLEKNVLFLERTKS